MEIPVLNATAPPPLHVNSSSSSHLTNRRRPAPSQGWLISATVSSFTIQSLIDGYTGFQKINGLKSFLIPPYNLLCRRSPTTTLFRFVQLCKSAFFCS
jgi:hypothetical protein